MGNFYLIADEAGLGKTTIANEIINRAAQMRNGSLRVIYVASNSRIARKNMNEFLNYDPDQIKTFQMNTAKKAVEAMYDDDVEYRTIKRQGLNCFDNYKERIKKYQADRLSMYHNSGIYSETSSFVISLSPKTSFLKGYYDLPGTEDERTKMRETLCEYCQFKTKGNDSSNAHEFYSALDISIEYEIDRDIDKKNNLIEDKEKLWSEKINELKDKANEKKVSPLVRRVFENANIYLMKPNIIILDEFQRFTDIFNPSKDGYSIYMLYQFVKWLKQEKDIELPKLVLLSATPYKYDHKSLENVWEMELREEGGPKGTDNEKPFDNFEQLIKTICNVTGDDCKDVKNNRENYYERTQRNQYFIEDDIMAETDKNGATIYVDEEKYKKHLEYLSSVYLINNEPNPDQSMRWLEQAPDFWRFCEGYKSLNIDAQKYCNVLNRKVENHFKLSTLIEKGMPKGSELLLWVAPTKTETLGGPFKKFTMFGKTLVFTHYKMAAKSIAANLTEIAEQRLDTILDGCDLTKINDIKDADFKTFSLDGNDIEYVISILSKFFNLPYVKKVVCAAYKKYQNQLAQDYKEMVKEYCKWGCLNDVLLEYAACLKDKSKAGEKLELVTELTLGNYVDREGNGKPTYNAAVYYTDDDSDSDTHNKAYEDELGERFNSPFFPFVMTVTATAQEGLDFHKYADKIMHWEPALNVNAFQQREGRIDRMGSITIRRRFYELCKDQKGWADKNSFDFFKDMKDAEQAEEIYGFLPDDQKTCIEKAKEAGIFPMWYIPRLSDESAHIERIIAASYFSKEYDAFDRLVRATDDYAKVLEN